MNTNAACVAGTVASHICKVVEHRWVNDRYRYLQLQTTAALAEMTKPGQFYQLRCPVTERYQPFLLRPMSVYGMGPGANRLEFLYSVTGVGTNALATIPELGAMEIVGPLGNRFTLKPSYKRIVVIARGVGLATMAPLIRQAAKAGIEITAVMSARSSKDLMQDEFLRGVHAQVHCFYDSDHSSAVENVELVIEKIIKEQAPDALYTCGSHRLLMLLQKLLKKYPEIDGEVALEQRMACGMGVCLSCVRLFDKEGDKKFLRVCREGPVFPIREVVGEVEFG